MVVVEMNKDVRDYKEKLIGPLSGRETVCFAVGLLVFYLVKSVFFPDLPMISDISGYILIACMIPVAIIGWVKIYGLYVDVFVKTVLVSFLAPKLRKYDNELVKSRKIIKTKPSKQKELKRFN